MRVEKVCSIRKVTSAVQGGKCAVPGRLHLQYNQKVVQCEERMCSIRRATSAIGEESVWCEQKVCSIGNVTSEVRVEKVCSTWRVTLAVQEEGCAV